MGSFTFRTNHYINRGFYINLCPANFITIRCGWMYLLTLTLSVRVVNRTAAKLLWVNQSLQWFKKCQFSVKIKCIFWIVHSNCYINNHVLFPASSNLAYSFGNRPENMEFTENFKNKKSLEFTALSRTTEGEVIMSIDFSGVTKQDCRIFLMILKLSGRPGDLLCE